MPTKAGIDEREIIMVKITSIRKEQRREHLFKIYKKHREPVNKLCEFLDQNQKSVLDYHLNFLCSLLLSATAKEKIRRLYVNAINAAGNSNLSSTGPSCQFFFKKIRDFPDDPKTKIDLLYFFSEFDDKISSFDDFFKYLVNEKSLKHFKNKKAALIIRDLNLVQKHFPEGEKIFTNYSCNNQHLRIPVDIVITDILNKAFNMKDKVCLKPDDDFELINEFAKEILGDEFMLIEELWFWWYFSLIKKNKKDNSRKLEFNEGKFYSDMYMYPTQEIIDKIEEFIRLVCNIQGTVMKTNAL